MRQTRLKNPAFRVPIASRHCPITLNAELARLLTQDGETFVLIERLDGKLVLRPIQVLDTALIYTGSNGCPRISSQYLMKTLEPGLWECKWNDVEGVVEVIRKVDESESSTSVQNGSRDGKNSSEQVGTVKISEIGRRDDDTVEGVE